MFYMLKLFLNGLFLALPEHIDFAGGQKVKIYKVSIIHKLEVIK